MAERELLRIDLPLWAHGMDVPHEWLFASRAAEPSVLVSYVGGTFAANGADVRNVAFQLLDVVWLDTTARGMANIPFFDGKRAVLVRSAWHARTRAMHSLRSALRATRIAVDLRAPPKRTIAVGSSA